MTGYQNWHIWSNPQGVLAVPEPLNQLAYTKIRRRYTIEKSGDGNWATVLDEHGTIRLTLVKLRPAKRIDPNQ